MNTSDCIFWENSDILFNLWIVIFRLIVSGKGTTTSLNYIIYNLKTFEKRVCFTILVFYLFIIIILYGWSYSRCQVENLSWVVSNIEIPALSIQCTESAITSKLLELITKLPNQSVNWGYQLPIIPRQIKQVKMALKKHLLKQVRINDK